MTREKARRLFSRLAAANPLPRTALEYSSEFELLVSVILSAQATDVSVNKVTAKLFPLANSPEALLDLGEAGLLAHIRSIGLAPSKAKNIIATCGILLREHGGQVPRTRDALEALPGVGRKTANVVLNVAFGQPTIAVDTHVFRVANRTGLALGKTVRQVEDGLLAITPRKHLPVAHHYLILHGRHVCKARRPECAACPILRQCEWPERLQAST